MGERIRAFDWAQTSLGAPETWPQSLRTAVAIVLGAASPLAIYWGSDFILLYNDAWRTLIGNKHPSALGQPGREVFPEIWDTIAPMLDGVMAGRGGVAAHEQLLPLDRHDAIEDAWFDYSFNPIPCADGSIGGILNVAAESTEYRHVREAQRQSEARYRTLFASIDEGFCVIEVLFDAGGKAIDYRFLEVNAVFEEQTGLRDAAGKRMRELEPRHEEHWFETYGRIARTGRPERFVNVAEHLGNRVYDVYAFRIGEPEGRQVAVLFNDITERKRAEEELRATEQSYRELIQYAPAGIYEVDFRRQRFTSVNDAMVEMMGYSRQELLEMDPFDLLDAESAARFRSRLARWLGGEEPDPNVEYRIRTRDGTVIDTVLNVTFTVDEDGRPLGATVVAHDITERKRAEEALRRYADRLQSLREVDAAILGAQSMAEVARAVVQRLPRLLACRRASVALYDLDRGEMSLLAVHAPDETQVDAGSHFPIDAAWGPALEQMALGRRYVLEDLQALPASSPLMAQVGREGVRAQIHEPILIGGGLLGTLNVGLSERGPLSDERIEIVRELAVRLTIGLKQARLREEVQRYAGELEKLVQQRTAALEASETRFRTVFEEVAIGIALVDVEGRLMATNPALQRVLGYDEQELAGMHFLDLLAEVGDPGDHQVQRLLVESYDEYALELQYVRRDGRMGDAIVSLSMLHQATDESPALLAVIEDVTERKRAQEALLRTERLAIMGRMAASLAHEVNNPIQAVVGCLDLAMEVLQEGGDAGQYMDVARQEVGRAARIVQQMRNLGRQREEEKEPADVGDLMEKVLILADKQARDHQVEISWQPEGGLPLLRMVPDRIQQVFLNLVLNAIDAMPQGGELRIRAERTEEPRGVQLTFVDTGTGITPDEVEHLFEAFYSTKELGLGLGLYVSRNIVREHGGRIGIETTDEGSTFTVWLPQG